MREGPIILDRQSSALFLALMSFTDNTKFRFPHETKYIESLDEPQEHHYIARVDQFGRKIYGYSIPNYSSREEWEKDMIVYQSARLSYIYLYLKDHYPNDPYAERYKQDAYDDYWVKKLNLNVDELLH